MFAKSSFFYVFKSFAHLDLTMTDLIPPRSSNFSLFVFNKKTIPISIPSKMSEKCGWVKRDRDFDVEIYVVRH